MLASKGDKTVSELIDNDSQRRKGLLKHLILQLHDGTAPVQVQKQLVRLLGAVPYGLAGEGWAGHWSRL